MVSHVIKMFYFLLLILNVFCLLPGFVAIGLGHRGNGKIDKNKMNSTKFYISSFFFVVTDCKLVRLPLGIATYAMMK